MSVLDKRDDMKRNVLYFLLLLLPFLSAAQELNCRVEVNSDQIQGTNKEVFTTLKEAITEYINDRKWSTAQISPVEQIGRASCRERV